RQALHRPAEHQGDGGWVRGIRTNLMIVYRKGAKSFSQNSCIFSLRSSRLCGENYYFLLFIIEVTMNG
ncbi:MAG: hypothetical protein AAB156_05865, partial [Pseudomonadota bacterium]